MPDKYPPLSVDCPTCGGPVVWSDESAWRPFCSNRCRLMDLGAWFSEDRGIPGEDADAEDLRDNAPNDQRGEGS